MAPGAGEEEHRVHHLAPGDLRWRAPSTRRVEQVGDEAPLRVGEREAEGHAVSLPVGCVSSSGTHRAS